jgi:hypothetical protein
MSHEKYLVRLVSLMDRLLDILAKNPEYIFISDGQFSMVDDYLQNRPERAEELKGYVKEGRLRVGPWFTQPLETLVSGEAMIRNLHYGIKGSEALGGAMRFSYEVDEFGHASQTPQVLKGFGIDGAIAWRGVPKDCRSAFEWVSPDGTSVVMLNTNNGYGAQNNKMVTLDTGHFHPTESVADKLSSLLLYVPEVMLHVSRPVRWDSDHVTIMNDDTLDLMQEIVRCDALDKVHIGLDYFDASINRLGAYIVGTRATQKCLLRALLEPLAQLRQYEANGQGFERLALLEEAKNLPWNAVWDMFCLRNGVPVGEEFIADIQQYEAEVTSKRV